MNKDQKIRDSGFCSGLKHFINRCNVSEKKISIECDVSLQLVYNWLNGKNIPTYKSLQKLYELGMNVTEMFSAPKDESAKDVFLDNQNDITYEDLRALFFNPLLRMRLFSMIEKRNNAFNNVPKDEKLNFLCKAIGIKIEELDKLNTLLFEVSKEK